MDILEEVSPYVGRICGSIALDDGPDAAQETLVIVFRNLQRLRDSRALAGWVRTIATREAVRMAKRRSDPKSVSLTTTGPDFADPRRQETAIDIRSVLEKLTPEHRAILFLHAYEDLEESAIANLLDLSRGTVKSRLHRARNRFRKEWDS